MKIITKIILAILLCVGYDTTKAQNLDLMPIAKRDSLLIATAKEIVLKHGSDYYREYQPPTVKRSQVPPKGELNPGGANAGRVLYNVLFIYNKEKEQLGYDFAASVNFWEDTGKPASVFFGNGWGHRVTLTEYDYSPESGEFSGKLNVRIFDHFGLDVEDIESYGTGALVRGKLPNQSLVGLIRYIPELRIQATNIAITILTNQAAEGFRAWFILQHYRGYRPFITVMEKEITIEG